jgi:hypothetical protein
MKNSSRTLMLMAAGVATACLAFADPVLAELYYTVGLLLFAFGIIIAVYSSGQHRAFWIGFVILFGIYMSQTTSSFLQYVQFSQFTGGRNPPMGLITSRLLGMVYEGLHPTEFSGRGQTLRPNGMPGNLIAGYMAFLTMGHTLIAIGLGVLGGRIAQRLAFVQPPTNNRSLEEILDKIDGE